jgi:hypothetical protein
MFILMFRLLHCISTRLTSWLYQVEIKMALLVEVSLAQLEGENCRGEMAPLVSGSCARPLVIQANLDHIALLAGLQGVVADDKMALGACLFWFTWITGLGGFP